VRDGEDVAAVRLTRCAAVGEASERVWRAGCDREWEKWSHERKSEMEERWNKVSQDGTSLSCGEDKGCRARASGTATLDERLNTPRGQASAVPGPIFDTGSSNTHVGCDVSTAVERSWADSGAHAPAETLRWQGG
jgi:hypothetical protein